MENEVSNESGAGSVVESAHCVQYNGSPKGATEAGVRYRARNASQTSLFLAQFPGQ
jgi:hypothetical protein